ncbi:hypothetical protein [Vibrio comitans]|uniref:hypothetical protein n=1 Tax=Vibrio comitans TaxID=413401 RepID=UPI001141F910|nr:hypothetical protein [Vibrio comitans]
MNYHTSESINALHGYLQEETCNEFLDLSPWLNQGWPYDELKLTVLLLRRLSEFPSITPSELLSEGFSPSLLKKTVPLLSDELAPLLDPPPSQASLNHLYDQSLPMMKIVNGGGYSLHRLNAKWMRVTSSSGRKELERMMLKRNNQVVGWVLMPHV